MNDELDFSMLDEEPLIEKEIETNMSESNEDNSEIDLDINDALANASIGGVLGKGLEKGINLTATKGEDLAEKLAFRSIGGYDSPEGKKFLKNEASKLGLPEGKITPNTIGRELLDENELGKIGLKSTNDKFESIDSKLVKAIEDKKNLLSSVKGTRSLDDLEKQTKNIIGKLDPEFNEMDAEVESLLSKNKKSNSLNIKRNANQLEDLKTKLQKLQKYQATRSDIPKDTVGKAKATAARQLVEELVDESGNLDSFVKNKEKIGKLGISRDILLGESLKGNKTPIPGLINSMSASQGNFAIPAVRTALSKGSGVAAKASDLLSKIAKSKPAQALGKKAGPLGAALGGFLAYNEAKAEGLDTPEALYEGGSQVALDLATAPIGGVEYTGPRKGSLEEKLESGEQLTTDEYKQLFNNNESDKYKVTNEISKDEADSIGNQMMNSESTQIQSMGKQFKEAIANDDEESSKALWSLRQQPAFRELLRRNKVEKNTNSIISPVVVESKSDINKILDRYSKMKSSGNDLPVYEIDQAFNEIDNLRLNPSESQELKDRLINSETPSQIDSLKELINSLKG